MDVEPFGVGVAAAKRSRQVIAFGVPTPLQSHLGEF